MLKKTTLQEIKHSLGRYIAIIAIVILGVGFFAGLKITKPDMINTADDYLSIHNFYDYQLITTLGFEDADVNNISKGTDVAAAEGSRSADVLYLDETKVDKVLKAISVPSNINTLQITAGRLPEKDNECVVDNNAYDEKDIGKTITLSDNNETVDIDKFKFKEYTIVGTCDSPLYLNYERGSTSIGNGSISTFMYIPKGGFNMDVYTEVYVDLKNSDSIYSAEYDSFIKKHNDEMDSLCQEAANRRYNAIVDDARTKLADAKTAYDTGYSQFVAEKKDAYSKLEQSWTLITTGESQLETEANKLSNTKASLEENKAKLLTGISSVDGQLATLENNKPYMTAEQYHESKAALDAAKSKLEVSLSQVNSGLTQVSDGEAKLDASKEELEQHKSEYYSGKSLADSKFAAAETKLKDAKEEIDQGSKDLDKIENPKTYILDRQTNIGYVCFENDSSLIEGIAKVFPIFFFLVAALVCMTTMTRMVDEQRTQIGVFKALGYSNSAIMSEYLFYAGSAAFIGASIGFFGGGYLFPKVIWQAYGMMYDFNPHLSYSFDFTIGFISFAAALICSMGSTYISCYSDFRIMPAELIRPKSPKNGKRILLEYITPIWSRISFLYKVTIRNIFRYKKRFFMMVLGISGCTALLLTGFGINDSVKNIVEFQYDEIMTYDYSISFDKAMDENEQEEFDHNTSAYVNSIYYLSEITMDFIKGNDTKAVKVIISDGKDIDKFIDLHTDSNKHISYPKAGEAVLCSELADRYNVAVGDTITIRNSDHDETDVKVSAICENYIYDYIYISPETYESGFGKSIEYKTGLAKSVDSSRDGVNQSSANIQKIDNVTATFINNDMRDRVNSMMTSMDAVILLVILSAGALAFVVLYNLTNINITERIREIATIKVLGFYPNETSAYVFRENFILTGISAFVGLFLGKWLHSFVMSQLKIDLISFDVRINTLSYILAIVLTFVFAIIVSFVMYFKLNKISMTESLKSIE